MKYALPEVSIEELERYLRAKNWSCSSRVPSLATVWHRGEEGYQDAEVVVPISRAVKDHDQRLKDAVASLAAFEQRDFREVAADITQGAFDLVTVRVSSDDTAGGRIPIDDGVLLIKKTRELLYSAALAVNSKRRHFGGAPPQETKEYMESLLLGQTEVGSYVVNVAAPASLTREVGDAQAEETSFTQIVAHSLVAGLSALEDARDLYHSTDDAAVFDRAVTHGASANMCDALLGFSGKDRRRSFEVRVVGPRGPLFVSEARQFHFGADDVAALEVASRFYKNDYVLRNREIVGTVKHLRRPQAEEVGTITVETTVGDSDRSVSIQLGPEDYHLGVQAHDRKLTVRCWGDLHVKSRSARLLNPSGFQLVDTPLF